MTKDEREAARKRVREAWETLRKQHVGEPIDWAELLIWGIEAYFADNDKSAA
jgi:hypothetical protein